MSAPSPPAADPNPVTAAAPPPPTQPFAVIVANPYTNSPAKRQRVEALADRLRRGGVVVTLSRTADALSQLIQHADFHRLCRCVIAAGGDGTLSRVINHPLGRVPVAHFPLGNENLFARHFGYPHDVDRFAEAVLAGRTRAVDVGVVNNLRFALVTSAGFDGAVAHRLHDYRTRGGKLRPVSRLTYVPLIAGTLLNYRFPMIDIDADGRHLRGSLVMVFNLPQYGMGLSLAPASAGPNDGRLHYLVFQRPGRLALLRYAAAVALGGRHLTLRDVHHGTAERIRLTPAADQQIPLETDGEATGHLPADIHIQPAGLTIVDC